MSAESLSGAGPSVSPLDCEHAVRRLWDYLDGRLTNVAREEVEAHLATCAACSSRFAFARTMQHALEQSAERDHHAEAGEAGEARLRARIREALRRQILPSEPDDADGNVGN